MAPFYGGYYSTVSRLMSWYKKTVYFLPLITQNFLVLSLLTSERWKTEFILEATQWFWTRDHWVRNSESWPLGHCSINLSSVNWWAQSKLEILWDTTEWQSSLRTSTIDWCWLVLTSHCPCCDSNKCRKHLMEYENKFSNLPCKFCSIV